MATKEYMQQWRAEHMGYLQEWRAEHKEQESAYNKKYYYANREDRLERAREWRMLHPEKVIEKNCSYLRTLAQRERQHLAKAKALMYYSNPKGTLVCNNCGEQDIDVLCIDHIDGDGAEHREQTRLEGVGFYHWLVKNNFPEDPKLQVLCFNCNMKKAKFDGGKR